MKIILVSGLKRSGKDYVSSIIKDLTNSDNFAYADPIKDIISISMNLTQSKLDNYKNDNIKLLSRETNGYEEEIINFRSFLQNLGSEALKKYFGKDVWANIALDSATRSNKDIIVMSDFRYYSEYKVFKESDYSVYTIKVINDDLINEDKHSSETELDNMNFVFDFNIDNTGKPKDILEKVKDILEKIRKT